MCVCELAGNIRSADSRVVVSTCLHFVRRKTHYIY